MAGSNRSFEPRFENYQTGLSRIVLGRDRVLDSKCSIRINTYCWPFSAAVEAEGQKHLFLSLWDVLTEVSPSRKYALLLILQQTTAVSNNYTTLHSSTYNHDISYFKQQRPCSQMEIFWCLDFNHFHNMHIIMIINQMSR